MTDRPIKCLHCERTFSDENAMAQHCRAKHPGKKKPKIVREQSLADEIVEARIAYACGEVVPDYLLDMFPDEIMGDDAP